MKSTCTIHRAAYTLSEFAQMMGRHRSWAYRMARAGKIKTIRGFGRELISADEVHRILQLPANEEGPSL